MNIQNGKIFVREVSKAKLAVCEDAGSFLQSAMWGEFKSRFGWEALAFLVDWSVNEESESTALLVLGRRLAPGFSFAYVPWGPVLPAFFSEDDRPAAMSQLAEKLKPLLARNTALVRFEPPWLITEKRETDEKPLYTCAGFKRAGAAVQPPDTVIINLDVSCEEILSQMKPKWRYNISLAQKKGVKVKTGAGSELELFYCLLKETAQRDGISIHNIDYYKTLFELCEKKTKDGITLRLYTASHEDDILAAIVVLFRGTSSAVSRGKEATYLYGASSGNKRNLMAPYALQWKAMQDAREMGCQSYDLFGIPPNEDPRHPMAGLYRFKTGFGGRIIKRPGTWDYPYKPFIYALFNTAERLRKKIRDIRKKR